jgi:hypothetical protein
MPVRAHRRARDQLVSGASRLGVVAVWCPQCKHENPDGAFLFALWRAAGGFVRRLRRGAAARCQVLPGMWPSGGHGAEPGQLHPPAHQRGDPGRAGCDRS